MIYLLNHFSIVRRQSLQSPHKKPNVLLLFTASVCIVALSVNIPYYYLVLVPLDFNEKAIILEIVERPIQHVGGRTTTTSSTRR